MELVKAATMNKKLRIIGAYIIAITCLTLYFVMETSEDLSEFLNKAERTRADWKFGTFAMIGLMQYGLLTIGISIIAILTTSLIRLKIRR